jgi:hypothetical protein
LIRSKAKSQKGCDEKDKKGEGRERTNGIPESHPLEDLHILGHGRTHEEGLIDFGKVTAGEDLLDVVGVTVGEDEVGFVDSEGLEAGEGEGLASKGDVMLGMGVAWLKVVLSGSHLGLEKGESSRGCSNDDIWTIGQEDPARSNHTRRSTSRSLLHQMGVSLPLQLSRSSTGDVDNEDLLVAIGREAIQVIGDLLRQLPRRHQDQRSRLLPSRITQLRALYPHTQTRSTTKRKRRRRRFWVSSSASFLAFLPSRW